MLLETSHRASEECTEPSVKSIICMSGNLNTYNKTLKNKLKNVIIISITGSVNCDGLTADPCDQAGGLLTLTA